MAAYLEFIFIETEGYEITCLLVLEFEIFRQLVLPFVVVAVTSPYLQLDDIFVVIIVDDEISTGFIARLSLNVVVASAIDDGA